VACCRLILRSKIFAVIRQNDMPSGRNG
jgi:hypothetical protein